MIERITLALIAIGVGCLIGILVMLQPVTTAPKFYQQPSQVLMLDGRRCMVFDTWHQSRRMYVVHCDDGSVTVTSNYLFMENSHE